MKFFGFLPIEPVFVQLVDNSQNAGRYTDRHNATEFLKEFGMSLAVEGIFGNIFPNDASLEDYESLYMSKAELNRQGWQKVATANLGGLSSIHVFDDFVFDHPVFGV